LATSAAVSSSVAMRSLSFMSSERMSPRSRFPNDAMAAAGLLLCSAGVAWRGAVRYGRPVVVVVVG
jgi:hypothetical protein